MARKPHKDKFRGTGSLRRRTAQRDPRDRVLIVCEGAKTEPNYLKELMRSLNLTSVNVEVYGRECDSSPVSVVNFAKNLYDKDRDYDRVYCVFDLDSHQSYNQALEKIRNMRLKKGHSMNAITSIPCFEFWLLLHFQYTTGKFPKTGNKSACDTLISKLKKHIPNYQKRSEGIFTKTKGKLPTAIANAKKVEKYHRTSDTDNHPSTKVYQLVEYLQELKKFVHQKNQS